jgi:hypothetical protein
VRQYVARQNVAEKSLWAGPTQKKVNMQIVAEKSLWAGPTGEKKKTKNYFVALQIVAEKSLWAGPTRGEKLVIVSQLTVCLNSALFILYGVGYNLMKGIK